MTTDLAERLVAYLQRETGLTATQAETPSPRLPQYLRAQFALQAFDIAGRRCVALVLKPEAELASAPALQRQIDKTLELGGEPEAEYCLVAADLSHYLRRRLMQAGTPFVVVDEQIYLPFVGTLMTRRRRRRAPQPPGETLGPAAQAVLIAVLLEEVPTPVTATELAERLRYTAMTMGRAVRVLEAIGFLRVAEEGRTRRVVLSGDRRRLWDQAQDHLRSPVRAAVRIRQADRPVAGLPWAGESALARATMLAEPGEPVFAMASAVWRHVGRDIERIPIRDDGTCLLELWRYPPETTARAGCVDPLSLALSLRDQPDERVQEALASLIEGLPW